MQLRINHPQPWVLGFSANTTNKPKSCGALKGTPQAGGNSLKLLVPNDFLSLIHIYVAEFIPY